jgi:hypothetical protein
MRTSISSEDQHLEGCSVLGGESLCSMTTEHLGTHLEAIEHELNTLELTKPSWEHTSQRERYQQTMRNARVIISAMESELAHRAHEHLLFLVQEFKQLQAKGSHPGG